MLFAEHVPGTLHPGWSWHRLVSLRKMPVFQAGTLAVPRQREAAPAVTVWKFKCTTGAREQGEVTAFLLCCVLQTEGKGSILPAGQRAKQ